MNTGFRTAVLIPETTADMVATKFHGFATVGTSEVADTGMKLARYVCDATAFN